MRLRSLLAAAGLIGAASLAPAPIVSTESGRVQGLTVHGVAAFKGLPYAAPPVGPLRWRDPRPPRRWRGVRPADRFGPECLQAGDSSRKSEDCLTLDVWRPAGLRGRLLPVMVWIHGGGLVEGRGSMWSGEALARQGVVVVSLNYRLGRLGFFAHPALAAEAPDEVHANYGFMDQRAALQWVRRNIAAFGGDPRRVTVFGESAGGGSALVHLTSPLSRGLLQGAILQSPATPTPRAQSLPLAEPGDAERRGEAWARSLGIAGDGADALRRLRALPAKTLVQGASGREEIAALARGGHVPGFAGATRDGRLIVEAPDAAMAAGRQAKVPVIVGATDRDLPLGTAATRDALFALFGRDAAAARRLYDPHGDLAFDELRQRVLGDATLIEPAQHLADTLARAGRPVWLYRFSYVPVSQRATSPGAFHTFDVPFAFDMPGAQLGAGETAAEDDRRMAALVSGYWVAFAATGDPNGPGRPLWPRRRPGETEVFDFGKAGAGLRPDPLKARLDLWARVYGARR